MSLPQVMSPASIPAFVWRVEGVGVSVTVSGGVLEQLRATLDQAPPDTEIGGILLGRIVRDTDGVHTQVDAFEPFVIEHRHGATFTLSPRDQIFLDKRLQWLRRKRRVPVGLYRSHNRRGLYVDQRDFEVFERDFHHPAAVFLLVRQDGDEARGAFFVWEENDMRRHASYLDFPLPARTAGAALPVSAPETLPAAIPAPRLPIPVPPRRAEPAPAQLASSREPRLPVPIPARRAEPAPVQLASSREPKLPVPIPVRRAEPAPAQLASSREPWRLDEGVMLSRQVAPNLKPVKVLATIALPFIAFFAAKQLAIHQAPSALPAPIQQVRTEPAPVPQQPPVESQLALAQPLEPKPLPFLPPAPEPSAQRAAPASSTDAKPSQSMPRKLTASANSRDRVAINLLRLPPPKPRPVPVLPEPPAVAPPAVTASLPKLAMAPSTLTAHDNVIAYFKPVPPSGVKQAFSKVPLLRNLTGRSTAEVFEPAKPVQHPLPSAPYGIKWKDGANVEMLANIDREGNVDSVKLVGGNKKLADASAQAILRWRFQPARQNGVPVDSAMRIRVEYHHPDQ